jgi:F-type H+-transporting ATPase subunit delta
MVGTRAAIRYAKAVLSLAIDNNKANEVYSDMALINSFITQNESLNNALRSPVVNLSDKAAVLNRLFPSVSSEIKSLLSTLVKNKRVNILGQIAVQYGVLYDQVSNKEKAFVTTATPMTPELESKVMNKLKSLTTKDVTLYKSVDEKILGGFVLRLGDQQYDASVSNQLNTLKNKFTIN